MSNACHVLTIATGKKLYLNMAVNLARSFLYWHHDDSIKFRMVTDQPEFVPADVRSKIELLQVEPDEFGKGFSPKLHLDKLAPDGQTLFIDSDSLIYGNLLPAFKKFYGLNVSVSGMYITGGEWFGDVASICKKLEITRIPKFNGGIYYLQKGPKATAVYETARELENRYDEIGFVRLRDRPNDEVLMALAIELNGEGILIEDGTIMAEFISFQSGIKSDLLNGVAELYNRPSHPNYQKNWHLTEAKPLIVHFLGHHTQVMPYLKEAKRLRYIFENGASIRTANLLTDLQVTLPFETTAWFKRTFRPAYRAIAGTRDVKKSERVID